MKKTICKSSAVFSVFIILISCTTGRPKYEKPVPPPRSETVKAADYTKVVDSFENPEQTVENYKKDQLFEGGTLMNNPLIWADVPDVDIIRVGDYFYMSSTSMHMMPGIPIMRSSDLVNWEIISYVYEKFGDNDAHNLLNGKSIYGKGSWATSLRYSKGTFYVCFASNDTQKTYIYRTNDIENGPWERSVLGRLYHDPSLLFDDDGKVYLVYGVGSISLIELNSDASAVMEGAESKIIVKLTRGGNIVDGEGSHIYKIDGKYYLFIIQWPQTERRLEWCFRSDNIYEGWEGMIVLNDDLGYLNKGVAHGGIVQTAEGRWYGMLFQDHDSVGRIPVLVPVTWIDSWPVMGVDGKVPKEMNIPLPPAAFKTALLSSDEFETEEMGMNWQWNHNPDNNKWSLAERPGFLRLKTVNVAAGILSAKNTVSQRTAGPCCYGEIFLDTVGMKAGDFAGLSAFQSGYGIVGVKMDESGLKHIVMAFKGREGVPDVKESVLLEQEGVYLRVVFDFRNSADKAYFYYSADGSGWQKIGDILSMKYTLDHFMGYRIAIFNYAALQTGGYVDIDYFHAGTASSIEDIP